MAAFPRPLRLLVFTAALLHALVGGWGAWLHAAPSGTSAAVAAAQFGEEESGAAEHGSHCALCHSASQHRAPPARGAFPLLASAESARAPDERRDERGGDPVLTRPARGPPSLT